MANVQLIPGKRYVATQSGAPSVTLTKQSGAADIARAALLNIVGSTCKMTSGEAIQSQTFMQVGVTDGTLDPAPLGTSVKSGATAALRKIVSTSATGPAAPTAATDGYSIQGAEVLHVVTQAAAGATDWQLYAYDAVSDSWALFTAFGTAGTLTMAPSSTVRTVLDVRGIDRISLRVSANGGGVACSGWALAVL